MIFVDADKKEELNTLADLIIKDPSILYADIETTGLDWINDKILLFQLKYKDQIWVIDVRGIGYTDFSLFIGKIANQTFVFHNGKFDVKFIANKTGFLLRNVEDTMLLETILNAGIGKSLYSLDELAEKYADIFMNKEVRSLFIDFPDDKPYTESMISYSALDVQVLEPIHSQQMQEIVRTGQKKVAWVENKLIPVVAKMEMNGIPLDVDAWLKLEEIAIAKREDLNKKLKTMIVDFLLGLDVSNGFELARKALIPVTTKKLTNQLKEITNIQDMRGWLFEKFNTGSPLQMKAVLNLMQIKVKNTNAKTLEDRKGEPIIDLLLDIREVSKQIESYGSNVIQHIHPATGKIHTEYFTLGTRTGRFSSSNPNMQQVPKTGGYRECFYPDDGYVFADVDYSQQEYRLAGAISREDVIIEAYKSGSDMHTATAQAQTGKVEVTKEERNTGKTINFAVLYGSTAYGLKNNLQIPLKDAEQILNKFWSGYPKLSKFMALAGKKILELGYSVTPLGRRRYNLKKPDFMNSYEAQRWEERVLREGKNHIIQGGGADILKIAMIEIDERNPFGDFLKLCLQVHDQLVVMVHKSIAESGLKFIIQVMEEVEQEFLGDIPAKADGDLKDRWSK